MPTTPSKKRSSQRDADDVVRGILDRPSAIAAPPVRHSSIEHATVRATARRDPNNRIVALELIDPDPDQPRTVIENSEEFDGLVSSVREHGVISPITVRFISENSRYQIITGERRFRAAQRLGLREIPACIREIDDTTKAVEQLVENVQREDMNPVEEALALNRLIGEPINLTHEEVALKIGKSRAYVTNMLALPRKLTTREQAKLRRCSPANMPGKSLILEALQAPDEETRAQILFGRMTRAAARTAVRKRAGGRPGYPTRSVPVTVGGYTYTITVKARRKERLLAQDVIDALDAAVLKLTKDVSDT